MGSVGAVGAAPVLSRDVVVAAVRDLAYVLSCCSDVSAALAGPFPLGTETWPLALPPLPHIHWVYAHLQPLIAPPACEPYYSLRKKNWVRQAPKSPPSK